MLQIFATGYYNHSIKSYDLLGAVILANALNLIGFFVFLVSAVIESRSPTKSKLWTIIFIIATLF
jgi:hypothetical protein